MPRMRVIIDLPDTDAAFAGDAVVDAVKRALADLPAPATSPGPGDVASEVVGEQLLDDPARGLVLNVTNAAGGDAMKNLLDLAAEVFPWMGHSTGVRSATVRRVLAGVEAVYIVGEQRFATSREADRVLDMLRSSR